VFSEDEASVNFPFDFQCLLEIKNIVDLDKIYLFEAKMMKMR
jgi:hypothetical protein